MTVHILTLLCCGLLAACTPAQREAIRPAHLAVGVSVFYGAFIWVFHSFAVSSAFGAFTAGISAQGIPPEPIFAVPLLAGALAFHPELFEQRALVLDHLAEHGFHWLEHFGSVDLRHDDYGLEVCGVHEHQDALRIRSLLVKLFPQWRHVRHYYYEWPRDRGWRVIISREQEQLADPTY